MKVLKLAKISFEYYVVFFLFFVLIFYAIYGNSTYQPYYTSSASLSQYPYEGFEGSPFPENVHNAADLVSEPPASSVEGNKGVLGIFSFDGLQGSNLDDKEIYDPVHKLERKASCGADDSGYSTSAGVRLCMTKDMRQTFGTRGGNA